MLTLSFRRVFYGCRYSAIARALPKSLHSSCSLSQPKEFCLTFAVKNEFGALMKTLETFKEMKISLKHIESRPLSNDNLMEVTMKYDQEPQDQKLQHLLRHLEETTEKLTVMTNDKTDNTPTDTFLWFPKHIADLDQFAHKVLGYGAELDADHPGFKDESYRKRRNYFADIAANHRHGNKIPNVDYTKEEIETWRTAYTELKKSYEKYACTEHNNAFAQCERYCGYRPDNVPQLQDISDFLQKRTGFTLRPVAGLLSSRDFLAGLAFRVFHCTQYIRHYSVPNYTPEPDACHELMGHVPLFADRDFARFSQEFGLISLGASEEVITKLGTLYWFTIEFGLCMEKGEKKAYGAGLLSSFGELQNAFSGKPIIEDFDPDVVATTPYPITEYQPKYFLVQSFSQARQQLMKWAQIANRQFYQVCYDPYTQSIEVLNNVEALKTFSQELKVNFAKIEQAVERLASGS